MFFQVEGLSLYLTVEETPAPELNKGKAWSAPSPGGLLDSDDDNSSDGYRPYRTPQR